MTPSSSTRRSRAQSRREIVADAVVHTVGFAAAIVGGVTLLALAAAQGGGAVLAASAIYAAGLLTMLACSAVYNFAAEGPRKDLFRRLDQAGIFLMIAGSYTPFTIQHLDGAWSLAMTAIVWSIAILGVVMKLVFPRRLERVSIAIYLALGWIALVAVEPLVASLGETTLVLLAIGGALYTAGVVFHLCERLPYQSAIWHGFVVAAAGVHYAAILGGVVLA